MAPANQDPVAIGQAVGKLDAVLDIVEAQLARAGFLAGDSFTLADIQFGHVLYRYFNNPIARCGRPALEHYYDRLTARPAFREHVMVSYEELRMVGWRRACQGSGLHNRHPPGGGKLAADALLEEHRPWRLH